MDITHQITCERYRFWLCHKPLTKVYWFLNYPLFFDKNIVNHLLACFLYLFWFECCFNEVNTIGSHWYNKSLILNSIYQQEKQSVMSLSFLKSALQERCPFLLNRLTIKNSNCSIFNSFFHFLLKFFLIKIVKISCHFTGSHNCKCSKKVGNKFCPRSL